MYLCIYLSIIYLSSFYLPIYHLFFYLYLYRQEISSYLQLRKKFSPTIQKKNKQKNKKKTKKKQKTQAIGWGCRATWKLSWGGSIFQLIHMELGRPLVLAVDINSLPNQSLQRVACNMAVCFPKSEDFRETEKDILRGHSFLYSLIWKVIP